jgi:hypothetical protein
VPRKPNHAGSPPHSSHKPCRQRQQITTIRKAMPQAWLVYSCLVRCWIVRGTRPTLLRTWNANVDTCVSWAPTGAVCS